MPDALPAIALPLRRPAWKWVVCGMLLLATMLNYMDRLTLNQVAKDIKDEFRLDNEQYGQIEMAFSMAFGLGALVLGCVADRWSVRWVYPAAVLAWSLAGFATGFVDGFAALLACRFLLGFTEAGHWPCALRTTQHVLPPEKRTLGNSILQSGASVGAVITPFIVVGVVYWTDTWRYPFLVVGGLGVFWVVLWLTVIRRGDLDTRAPSAGPGPARAAWLARRPAGLALTVRRFGVLVIVVVCINITWHFFRVWLPLFLQEAHGYSRAQMSFFVAAYYAATDAGCLAAGFATRWLARRGLAAHASQVVVFAACALLTTLSCVVAGLPPGPLLLAVMLVIGFGALGLFPNYYSFSQELTVRHQGKVTGLLGFLNWQAVALFQWLAGISIDQTHSYSMGLTLAGITPLVGLAALVLLWGKDPLPAGDEPTRKETYLPAADGSPVEEHIRADVRGITKR
jgi:ACS family hexuronate transporter-like MFS transporter